MTEVIHDDGSPTEKTFEHVPTEIGAEEAEEVGAVGDVGGGCDDIRVSRDFMISVDDNEHVCKDC